MAPFLDDSKTASLTRLEVFQRLPDAEEIYFADGTRIAKISTSTVVKYGPAVRLWEAENMRFVRKRCSFRLPEVLDCWRAGKEEDGSRDLTLYERSWRDMFEEPTSYIMMTYIPGHDLQDCWAALPESQQHHVAEQLRDILTQLHNLKLEHPGPIGGGLSQGAWFTDFGAGPFASKRELEMWFDERREVSLDFGKIDDTVPSFQGKFSQLVMCHMDLHLQNLRLDLQGHLWILDWTFAGGYPVYFEKASLMRYDHWPQRLADLCIDSITNENDEQNIDQLSALAFALTTGAFCRPRRSNGLAEGTFQPPYKI